MKIIIPGKPIQKNRPRFTRFGRAYSDQKAEVERFTLLAREQINIRPFKGPIIFKAVFYMPIPKKTSGKSRVLMINGKIRHIKTPDLDNLIKFAMDCLNGEAWNDDSQVVGIRGFKIYSDDPRTEITIEEV